MYCSNCGQELAPGSKFCSNCGAPVIAGASVGDSSESDRERQRREDFERAWGGTAASPDDQPTTQSVAVPDAPSLDDGDSDDGVDGGFGNRKAQWEIERENMRQQPVDEWSMTDLGPAKPQRRRTWLWVLLGIMAVFIIACCVFGWWLSTDSGTEWFEGIATQAAEEMQQSTETSATPEP